MNSNERTDSKEDLSRFEGYILTAFFAVMIILALIAAKLIFKEEAVQFYKWTFTLELAGLIFMPLTACIFKNFRDLGFIFSKVIALAISGWLMWYLSSLHIMKFTFAGCVISLSVCLVLNALILYFGNIKKKLSCFTFKISRINIVTALAAEFVFLCVFIFWLYIKGFAPYAYGTTEKLMDLGFMEALFKSDYMPPEDLWFAGESLNYYYVGQYMATYLSKLSGTGVEYGYNFMLMMVSALGFSLPCSIVSNVSFDFIKDRCKKVSATGAVLRGLFVYICAALAGIAVDFAGNLHYCIYAKIVPGVRTILEIDKLAEAAGEPFADYWFPNATRFIGYNPDAPDKTIHEFPVYSFVLGDLHAHVINIIFVLTLIAILYSFLQQRRAAMDDARLNCSFIGTSKGKGSFWGIPDWKKEVFSPAVILTGFFIGLFHTTNYWDFPIYFVVAGAVILFSNCVIYNFKLITLKLTLLHAIIVIAVSTVVCLPFTITFNNISSGIALSPNHTSLYQLIVLWGLPFLAIVTFIVVTIRDMYIDGIYSFSNKSVPGRKNPLFRFIGNLPVYDLFIITLGLCAMGLILLPEVIYVKDIYSGDYKRANTMFKLVYQAFIMFGICMGYAIPKLIIFAKRNFARGIAIVCLLLLIWTTGYFTTSVNSWFGDVSDRERYISLDSGDYLKNYNQEDYEAVNWINSNIEGRPVMLEANGDSYTYNCRVSVRTGLPTVLGWRTHEWLWQSWRNKANDDFDEDPFKLPPVITERTEDIETIYTSSDYNTLKELTDKYNIEYIYVGKTEREMFGKINIDNLLQISEPVYPDNPDFSGKGESVIILKVK